MKVSIILKAFCAVLVSIIVVVTFNACKKQDIQNENSTVDKETIEKVKSYVITHGGQNSTTFIINSPATEAYYADARDKKINLKKLREENINAFAPLCVPPIDDNGDPVSGMAPSNFILNSIGYVFDCGGSSPTNYKMSFKWSLAVRQVLQVSNNFGTGGATLRSRYKLEIKNSAGIVIATYNPNFILAEDIRNKGDWSVDPTRRLYEVYATINIPSTVFNSGVTYATTLTMATDCNQLPQVFATHTTTTTASLNTQPCIRTDKVWINPGTGAGGIATASGTFIVCSIPPGYTTAGTHELEFRKQTNTTSDSWDAQPIATSPIKTPTILGASTANGNPFSTTTGVVDLDGMISGSGTWLVRYRNKGTCTTPGPWLVEKWPL